MRTLTLTAAICAAALAALAAPQDETTTASRTQEGETSMSEKITKTDEQWKAELTPEQYRILRLKGTERPGTGAYVNEKSDGIYRCAGCGEALFDSNTKFDSCTGWPSFTAALGDKVVKHMDYSHGMVREEVVCAKCGGHLGHVFDDGPLPTGQRYCINSVSLKLEKKDGESTGSKKTE